MRSAISKPLYSSFFHIELFKTGETMKRGRESVSETGNDSDDDIKMCVDY